MNVYTGRGDEGRTDLRDLSEVSKASPRIEAYGAVDELNALVGTVRPTGHDDVDADLREIQNVLHVVQADLANPSAGPDDPVVREAHHEELEGWMDDYDGELEPLTDFVLPSGSESAAALHHARTVCRRAERRAVELAADEPTNEAVLVYLNRLSDTLFVLARVMNARDGVAEEHPTY
jgi:cob(I)alamin adenosyltransferase